MIISFSKYRGKWEFGGFWGVWGEGWGYCVKVHTFTPTPMKTPHPLQPVNIPTPIQSIVKEGETTDFRFSSPAPPSLERIPSIQNELERQERAVAQSRLPVRVGAKPKGRPLGSKNKPKLGPPERIPQP
jgi:hypothetical protein